MRINLRLVLTFLAIVVSATLWAAVQQEIRISGTVISDGEPLPGVSVQIKGETTGTITDMDGKYSISAPSDAILVYRFVGLKTVEQPVNGRNMINVTLESDSKELDEVMVVAYATAKKYSFTGAASTVKGDEIAKLQVASVSRALEGTVSGVQASQWPARYGCGNPYPGYRFYQCFQCTALCGGRCPFRWFCQLHQSR